MMKELVTLDGQIRRISDLSFQELLAVIDYETEQNEHYQVPVIIAEWFYYDSRENSMVYKNLADGFGALRFANRVNPDPHGKDIMDVATHLIDARLKFRNALLELIRNEYGEDVSSLIYDCL